MPSLTSHEIQQTSNIKLLINYNIKIKIKININILQYKFQNWDIPNPEKTITEI